MLEGKRKGGGELKKLNPQKQCTRTYDEQETRVTVGLFNRESVGEQECFKVAFEGVGCCCLAQ